MLVCYSLMMMLDSHVVVESVRFVPDDVKRKTLQSSTLQQEQSDQRKKLLHLWFLRSFLNFGRISLVDDDDDVDVQSCFFHPLLCTRSHLLVSSRIKQLY